MSNKLQGIMEAYLSMVSEAKEEVSEGPVDGVAPDQHMCASKIFKEGMGEGTPVIGEHAEPDENGHIAWYKVMFEHGEEIVEVAEEGVEVLEESMHGNHKKKKTEAKELDPVGKADADIDNDGDVDKSDDYLKNRRKAIGKAMKKDKKGNMHTKDKTAEISKIDEAFEELWAALAEASDAARKKSATPPEGIMDKESPKSKEFAAMHNQSDKKLENDEEDGHVKTFAAARGGPSPKARPGDNLALGDRKSELEAIMKVLGGQR